MSMTQTRRNALRLFAGPPVLAILPMMMAPSDAHLLAMEAEIMRLRGLARDYAAQAALMIAPAPVPITVFQKWELLDHLMTDEIVNGPFTVKEALIALASIKADILRFGLKEE
jgi:hypothetical protein